MFLKSKESQRLTPAVMARGPTGHSSLVFKGELREEDVLPELSSIAELRSVRRRERHLSTCRGATSPLVMRIFCSRTKSEAAARQTARGMTIRAHLLGGA